MTTLLPPLLLRPIYVAKPWGGRRLETDLGRTDLPAGRIGESWEVVDTEDACSLVDGGPHDGERLRDVLGAPFPLLLKVLDAQEDLSVQVHPDGADGRPAKEEAWVSLADGGAVATGDVAAHLASTGAVPAAGSWLTHLERHALRGASAKARTGPSLVHVPPRMVHSILAGSLLFEVQNPVDVTWRLDDFARVDADGSPRPLHIEEAQAVLARGAAAPVAVSEDGCRLDGERFWIRLLGPGTAIRQDGLAAFFVDAGGLDCGVGEDFAVPAGRTVVLTESVRAIHSTGWIVIAGV